MTDEKRIVVLERLAHTESKWPGTEDTLDALDAAISALRDRIAHQNPQPLTLEELREMDGEPVWIEFFSKTSRTGKWNGWAIVDNRFETQEFMEMHHLKFSFYGKSWKAYRRPPERSENDV